MEKLDFKYVKRTVKDTIFSDLFSIPKYKKMLYLSLFPEDNDIKEDEIETVTLKNILTKGIINDLAIVVREKLLLLMEAQSSWNENMAFRMLEYLAESLNQFLRLKNRLDVYHKKMELPKLELFLLYSGNKEIKNNIISFKEEYFPNDDDCPIDLKIKVVTLTSKNNIINEYIQFTKIFDKCVRKYGYSEECIKECISESIENNILVEYLTNRKKEVAKIMLSLFDQEVAVEDYGVSMFKQGKEEGREEGKEVGRKEGREEGRKEGREEGRKEERKNIIDFLVRQGIFTREEAIKKLNFDKNNKC